MQALQHTLLAWYAAHRRPLPWRDTRDPYRILVSEVMLQQTQAARVAPFYLRFLERFPDAASLAAAGDEELHRAWKGLGYPSRAERLRAACRAVLAHGWPASVAELEALPGVGPYTARAVAAFAFGLPVAVLDTNTARVLCRRDGLAPRLPRARLQAHADAALYRPDPSAWNNALMELGALVCTARAPRCPACPWRAHCAAAGDAARHTATAAPLRAAAPRTPYGGPAPRARRRRIWALVHRDGAYAVLEEGGGWTLPNLAPAAGADERAALAAHLAALLGAEVLAARLIARWTATDDDGVMTAHRCYRVRLFAAADRAAAPTLCWLSPAALLARSWPLALAPLAARLQRYHRLGG